MVIYPRLGALKSQYVNVVPKNVRHEIIYGLAFSAFAVIGVYWDLFRRFVDFAHANQTAWVNTGALTFLALLVCGYALSQRRAVAVASRAETGTDVMTGHERLKRADMALHRAKIEADMRQAIRDGEIKAYYQPLVTLSSGEIEGYEVLARWHHPHGGTIAPHTFISVVEDMGLIDQLTLQLLDQACRDAQAWPDNVYISLNISPSQLTDHRLSRDILAVMKDHDFAPSRLEVEVTENALVADYDTAKLILLALKHQGVRIALDDFGTGYSNLNHLRELPFDKLKIDSSFIIGAQRSPANRKIVEAILSLCKSLDLNTTAEGIENFETAHWLSECGCKTGQGFLFGKAITGEEIAVNGFCDDQIEALRIALSALIAADPDKSAAVAQQLA